MEPAEHRSADAAERLEEQTVFCEHELRALRA